jgi:phage-related minor tail protein
MELSTLEFTVNTSQLKEAHALLKSLGPAMSGVGKGAENLGKGVDSNAKAEAGLVENTRRATQALSTKEKMLEKQALKLKILREETIDFGKESITLEKAFTAGQASSLAGLKIAGATAEEFTRQAESFKALNQIIGGNSLDQSINGLTRLKKETEELGLVQKLASDGIKLTRNELRELSRDINSIRDVGKIRGTSAEDIEAKVLQTVKAYEKESSIKATLLAQAKSEEDAVKSKAQAELDSLNQIQKSSDSLFRNRINFIDEEVKSREKLRQSWQSFYQDQDRQAKVELAAKTPVDEQPGDKAYALYLKEQQRQLKEVERAHKTLGNEMQRVDTILSQLNQETDQHRIVSDKTAESVARYSRQLKLAGISGADAAKQLDVYRAKMLQIEAIDQKRSQQRLANALAPQISDVAVSVAGGMPLHLIAMQQGLQIRDLIGQSGVAAEELDKVMRSAMKNMVVSIGGTIAAMGQLTFGAMKDLGNAVIDMPAKLLKVEKGLANIEAASPRLTQGFRYLVAGGVGLLAGALATLTYETVKMIGVNNDLARQLAQTGNVFGANYSEAREYAKTLGDVGVSVREATEVMTLMAATSELNASHFKMVATSAENMEKYADVAIKDTVAAFNKLAEDPVKALTELAIKTGSVSPELLDLVTQMDKYGDRAGAAALAMQSLANHNATAVKKMQEDLHPLTKLLKEIGDLYDKFSDGLTKGLSGATEQEKLEKSIAFYERRPSYNRSDDKLEALKEQLRYLNRASDLEKSTAQEYSRSAERRKLSEEYRQKALSQEQKLSSEILAVRKQIDNRQVTKEDGEAYIKKLQNDLDNLKKKEAKRQAKEVERVGAYEKTALEQLSDAYNQKALKDLDPVQKKLLDLMNDPKFLQQSMYVREEIESQAAEYSRLLGIQTQATNNNLASEFASEKLSEAYGKTVGTIKNLTEIERQYLSLKNDPKYLKASEEQRKKIDDDAFRYIRLAKSMLLVKDAEEGLKQIRGAEQKLKDLQFEESLSGKSERQRQIAYADYNLQKGLIQAEIDLWEEWGKVLNETDADLMLQKEARLFKLFAIKEAELRKSYDMEVKYMTDMAQRSKDYDAVFKGVFDKIGDGFVTFVTTGKDGFKDMIDNMLADLLRLEIKMQMMKMYESMGGGSKDGILGSLLKLGVGAATGSPTTGATTASASSLGIGSSGSSGLNLMVTKSSSASSEYGSSKSNVQIVINNNSAASISQKETVDSRGNRRVELTVSEMVAGEVKRNGSMMQRSMSNTFGSKPTLISR